METIQVSRNPNFPVSSAGCSFEFLNYPTTNGKSFTFNPVYKPRRVEEISWQIAKPWSKTQSFIKIYVNIYLQTGQFGFLKIFGRLECLSILEIISVVFMHSKLLVCITIYRFSLSAKKYSKNAQENP